MAAEKPLDLADQTNPGVSIRGWLRLEVLFEGVAC